MESGLVVEYIDKQRILCAVVLEVKQQRLRLLTENSREVSLAPNRLSHQSAERLDLAIGRDRMVDMLKQLAARRDALTQEIDIRELWEVLNSEQEWIDLGTMTAFCFPETTTSDHESAVIRAFFGNRRYFKFNSEGFFPHSERHVEQLIARENEKPVAGSLSRTAVTGCGTRWPNRASMAAGRQWQPGAKNTRRF
jgi:exoribonuclease-2